MSNRRRNKRLLYRNPSRRRFLSRVVRNARANGRRPREEDLEELARANAYAEKKRQNRLREDPWVTGRTFGLKPVISFDREDGTSLQEAIREIEVLLRVASKGTSIEAILRPLQKRQRKRLSWAVHITKILKAHKIELKRVRTVHISEKDGGVYVIAVIKNSGQTFGGEFAL